MIGPAGEEATTAGHSLGALVVRLTRRPAVLVEWWNWKTAVTSASCRGLVFFCANASAGYQAAVAALQTELVLRFATSGFYGGLTEALAGVTPAWQGMTAAMVVLPIATHTLEFVVHWWRHTAELTTSILGSMAFTVVSTSFNIFTMRHGVLTVGRGRQPLHRDLMMMPVLILRFIAEVRRSAWKAAAHASRWR